MSHILYHFYIFFLQALSQEERNKYCEKAKQLNERVQRAKSNPSQARGKVQQPLTNTANFVTSDEMPPEHKIEMEESRASVFKIFRSEDWASHPIVICHFTLYNELEYYHDMHIPAEIGLSTMSLNNGVIDNYARIIDMSKNIFIFLLPIDLQSSTVLQVSCFISFRNHSNWSQLGICTDGKKTGNSSAWNGPWVRRLSTCHDDFRKFSEKGTDTYY